jgi:uncharacterized membrane protein YeaQ/YmgE (transglycosylase-associated protein family)
MILAVFLVLIVVFVILPIIGVALWFIISTAVVGLIVGALGRLIVPGSQPIGFLATVACGLVGSLVGGGIGHGIDHGRLVTILLEVGIAAAAVAVWSAADRRRLGGRHDRAIGSGRPGW